MNNAELRAIEASDTLRRAQGSDELIALALAYYGAPDDYHVSRGITGEPSEKNRTHRASDNCWNRGLRGRTVGIAPGTTTPFASVAVTKDGQTTIVSASSFRKANIATKSRKHKQAQIDNRPEVLRYNVGNIGNVE